MLEKRLKDYHFEYVKLKRRINLLEAEIEDLDKCVDRKIVIDLIQEIVPSIIDKKGLKDVMHKCFSYLFESSKDSDLVEIIEVKERKDIPHKQQRKIQPRKFKQFMV